MPKPISERIKKPSYWYADQLPHWGIGLAFAFAISFPWAHSTEISPVWPALVAVFVSDLIGTGRELIQNWGDEPAEGSTEDTQIDGWFWRLGAFLGAIPSIFV